MGAGPFCGMHLAYVWSTVPAESLFPCRNGPGRPGTPKQVVREGSTLRFRLERIGYLNIASICSRKHEWGLNTMPHPNFFGVLKGSREGARDGAPSAASEIVKGLGANNVLGETFWPKRFGRKFCFLNHILHLGLGAGLGWAGRPGLVAGWAGLGWRGLELGAGGAGWGGGWGWGWAGRLGAGVGWLAAGWAGLGGWAGLAGWALRGSP